jgi:hypothetical protein
MRTRPTSWDPGSVNGRKIFSHTISDNPEQKKTWLWLWGLDPLQGTKNVFEEMLKLPNCKRHRTFYMTPADNRGLERSRTFPGIAAAMADQWG